MMKKTMSQTCAGTAHHAPARGVLKNAVPFPAGGGGVAHFISKPLYRLIRPLADGRCAIFIFAMILSAMPGKAWGQTPCEYGCLEQAYTYKCIIASSVFSTPTSITNFIGTGVNDELVPMPGAETTLQRVVITGWVEVDVNYTFATGSDIVFADSESGLIVNNGAVLTFKESPQSPLSPTTLRGCNVLWGGIYVRANSTLVFENRCAINDAYSAVNLYHNSTLISTGAVYAQNFISIQAQRVAGDPAKINVNTSLTGNQFLGDAFLNLYNGLDLGRPSSAIVVEDVNQFSIGATGMNVQKNVFRGYAAAATSIVTKTAVVGINTNLKVCNSTFEEIGIFGNPATETACIAVGCFSTDGKTYLLEVSGLGKTALPTFSNAYVGIQCYGVNLTVDKCNFVRGVEHIRIQPLNPSAPPTHKALSYTITNCSFSQHITQAIIGQNVFPALKFDLKDNHFDNNSLAPDQTSANFISVSPAPSRLTIDHNTVSSTSLATINLGFSLSGVNNALIKENTFSASSPVFASMNMVYSDGGIVKDNWVTGGDFGVFVNGSGSTDYRCNVLTGNDVGMRFDGYDCDGSRLIQNSFGAHTNGLLLENATTIGQQNTHNNSWPSGSTNPQDALFDLLDPVGSPSYYFKLNQSMFFIDVPENNTSNLWATPRTPGQSDWFEQILPNPQPTYCAGPAGGDPGDPPGGSGLNSLTATDDAAIMGDLPELDGFAATLWDAQFRLSAKLYAHPELRPSNSAASNFYAAHQGTPFAKFAAIYKQMGDAMEIDNVLHQTLSEQYEQSKASSADIARSDSLLAASSSPYFAQSLWQDRSSHVQGLTDKNAEVDQLLTPFASARTAQWQSLLAQVNAVTTSKDYEANMKVALRVWLESADQGWHLSAQQQAELSAIASQCRLSGGFGVRLARLLLQSFDYDDNCGVYPRGQGATNGQSGQQGQLLVYPNPTEGQLFVRLNEVLTEGWIVVSDQMGRTVASRDVSGVETLELNIGKFPSGTYVLHLIEGGKAVSFHKVFLRQ